MEATLKKTLDSGKELYVSLAPFAVGHKLLKAVTSELETIKISMGLEGKNIEDFFNLDITDQAIDTLKNVVSRAISSEKVESVLWECMSRATYDNKKITADVFEDVEARGDFLVVAKEVLWFNLRPFLKNLSSMFSAFRPKAGELQK